MSNNKNRFIAPLKHFFLSEKTEIQIRDSKPVCQVVLFFNFIYIFVEKSTRMIVKFC